MSSNYPSTPYSNHPAHLPARPNYFSNYDPRTNSLVASNPYSMQYRTDAYGRQLPPGPAPPHSGNGFSPSQPGRPQTLPSCAQPCVLNGQYRQNVNINPDIPMTRGSSSRSYGTEGDSPQSQRSSEGPKERPWFCFHPGCLTNGHLTAFTRKEDLNRHLKLHVPCRELYDCPVPGCNRVGDKGLPRRDKLTEHVNKTHRGRG